MFVIHNPSGHTAIGRGFVAESDADFFLTSFYL